MKGIKDITASVATSALSCDAPKLDDSANTNINSQTSKNDVDNSVKGGNGSDYDGDKSDEEEGWEDEHEHDEEHLDDNIDTADNYDDIFGDEYDDMGPPESDVEEHRHSLGGSEVTFKLFIQDNVDEFDDWMHTIHVHCSSDGKEIGRAFGRFVRRDWIRPHFWRHMEEPCQELSSIAFGLFDRYGRLDREFINHVVRNGTGCWGSEVDVGPLFIIEHIQIERIWRRKGVGKKMIDALIGKASAEKKRPDPLTSTVSVDDKSIESLIGTIKTKRNKLAFTLVIPGWLNGDIEGDLKGKTASEQQDVRFAAQDVSVAFFRSIGFRRIGASSCFGLAVDPNHKAHKVSINDDYDPPYEEVDNEYLEARHKAKKDFFGEKTERSLLMELLVKRLPLHHAALILSDDECVNHYEEFNKVPDTKEEWKKVDKKLNNILHVASCEFKTKTVEWLLNNADEGQILSSDRNIKGYTALEALRSALEVKRTTIRHGMMKVCISDEFPGFPVEAVGCLAALQGIKTPSRIQSLRLKFGCTCGQCANGFFSTRMKHALLCQAEINHDMLQEYTDDGPFWVEMHSHSIRHVDPDIQRNFRTNKSLRQGFVNIFDHAATTMRKGHAPIVQNVIDVWENSSEWPPVTRSYFQRGGAVVDALRVMFECARDEDRWAGGGGLQNLLGDEEEEPAEIAAMPHCRNDLEFGMVAMICGMPDL